MGCLASRKVAAKPLLAVGHILQGLRAGAQVVAGIGEVGPLADEADDEAALAPALADAGIEHGRFQARVGADEQDGVGLLDAGDGGVEQIAGAAEPGIELGAVLPAIEVARAQAHEAGRRARTSPRRRQDRRRSRRCAPAWHLRACRPPTARASSQPAGSSRPLRRM